MSSAAISWIANLLTNRQQRVKQGEPFGVGKCSGWSPTGDKTRALALYFKDKRAKYT